MLAIALGLGVAVTYGTGDFFGGVASSRARVASVIVLAHLAGALGLLVVVPFAGGRVSVAALADGAAGGLIGLCGLLLFYRGLAGGRMAVVAPVSAVVAAMVPVLVGVLRGERLGALAVLGIVAALVGVVLVSTGEGTASGRPVMRSVRDDVLLALGAGLAFGVVFAILGSVPDDGGLWPVLAQRVTSTTAVSLALVASGSFALPGPGARRPSLASGLLDTAANALFVLAARAGDLAVAGVLGSLYPVATVVLAWRVLHEHVRPVQIVGVVIALGGAGLLAV